jgi:hypothetical protein
LPTSTYTFTTNVVTRSSSVAGNTLESARATTIASDSLTGPYVIDGATGADVTSNHPTVTSDPTVIFTLVSVQPSRQVAVFDVQFVNGYAHPLQLASGEKLLLTLPGCADRTACPTEEQPVLAWPSQPAEHGTPIYSAQLPFALAGIPTDYPSDSYSISVTAVVRRVASIEDGEKIVPIPTDVRVSKSVALDDLVASVTPERACLIQDVDHPETCIAAPLPQLMIGRVGIISAYVYTVAITPLVFALVTLAAVRNSPTVGGALRITAYLG